MTRLVVVSNRVEEAGKNQTSVGGLAVSIQAALETYGGIWFGWSGKYAAKVSVRPNVTSTNGLTYATLDLSPQDYEEYYSGYANRVIWPVFHYRPDLMTFRRKDYDGYRRVNAYFAKKLAPLLEGDDFIWVHDYHLIPLAHELRQKGVNHPIGFFLHIPFPVPEVLTALPGHHELVESLCAYDVVGFQTEMDLYAFHNYITREIQGQVMSNGIVKANGRTFFAGVFPIGIDVENAAAVAEDSKKSTTTVKMQESLHGRPMIIGVDRLDYSKGIMERFLAFEHFLQVCPEFQEQCATLIQIAPLSRSDVQEYKEMRDEISTAAGRINGRFSEFNWVPIRYMNHRFKRRTLMGFFRTSHVGFVTPLRDGMNLVAKEYIAAQDPEDPGVLVLSHFAGAVHELDDHSLVVNPYNIEEVADALKQALVMPLDERQARWTEMMKTLRRNDITTWREKFVAALREAPYSVN
ncbi:MAG: alpha,alpha-trehalose-phosphate synthase (UDP-forming) [Alphaproteobacteria bacterium]|nr:alpha,alpha-trehalose-phosphate synthase (UDP-forming) [Alphaproteobacteria bacterium]